ncbi:MAG: FMN-binding protein [Candidatus Nomurabacteria bacterium]|nr:FMN-binding protein [Candidatus Nomurabacteria bacterium]
MKKVFLSLTLFFSFAAYVLYVRILGASAPVVLTPEPNKTKTALSLPKYNTSTSSSKTKSTTSTPPVSTPPPPVVNTGKYKNGSYTGTVVDAYYGNVQVMTIISGGKVTDVQFLDYPQSRQTSIRINSRAMPYLTSEAIALQDSNVDTVSGASFTSAAFRESLSSALAQARI